MTRKKKCYSKSNSFVAAVEQVCLQPVLNTGRPFHTFVPATGKASPPIVDRRPFENGFTADGATGLLITKLRRESVSEFF